MKKNKLKYMKILNFCIKNYKSIVDSKICYLEKDLTIFAGKNESGKSTILEALYNFNINEKISDESISIINADTKPEIKLRIQFQKEELINYFEKINEKRDIELEIYEVDVTKTYPNDYLVDDESKKFFFLDEMDFNEEIALLKNRIVERNKSILQIHNKHLKPHSIQFYKYDANSIEDSFTNVNRYYKLVSNSYQNSIKDINDRERMLVLLHHVVNDVVSISNYLTKKSANDNLNCFLEMLPNFILFRSFEDEIPNTVSLNEINESDFIKDIELISNFKSAIILEGNDRDKSNHKEKVNVNINKDYKEFWSQDNTSFEFDWDNVKLLIWIKENGLRYRPTERSKGKQWHLSFYIRVSARSKESNLNVILIDEPGMHLHPKAQEDIYNKLLNISEYSQVIFTTHSPYLLRYDEMDRIRLVLKTDDGSFINQKVHSNSDKETLTPIMTAIGLELTNEVHSINKLNNVIVEGPADFFYLQAIKQLWGDLNYNFIFGGGSGKMPYVGTILNGWGCNVVYLYDNDQGKRDGEKNLKNNWFIEKENIGSILDDSGSIEDLFDKNDFKKYILDDVNIEYENSNSSYLRSNKQDKVLLSRNFLRKVRENEVILSKKTNNNIENLKAKIDLLFSKKPL